MFRRVVLMIGCLWLTASSAAAREPTDADCFDAKVVATLVSQTPTAAPECDDCIVMSWPWFLDYQLEKVLNGSAPLGLLTVLSIQHSDYRDDPGAQTVFLRRNDLGGFNRIPPTELSGARLCPPSTAPAPAYIQPGPGETLDDFRREGEARYGAAADR